MAYIREETWTSMKIKTKKLSWAEVQNLPRPKHKKRRLTYYKKLEMYKKFLKKDAEIRFKTDDDELFAESLDYFKESGFDITFITYDMTQNSLPDNIITEHEQMFMNDGIKIKGLIAVYPEVQYEIVFQTNYGSCADRRAVAVTFQRLQRKGDV